MSHRRTILLYGGILLFFFVVVCRLYQTAQNTTYAARAAEQTVTTLPLDTARGNFYDRDGEPLTGIDTCYYALCVPGEQSYATLFDQVSYAQQSVLYQKRNAAVPFLIQVSQDLTDSGIYTVTGRQRYSDWPVCTHLIGYLDGEGHGVSGLEAALDELLQADGAAAYVQCVTNAQGALMEDTQPIYYEASETGADVQLTIDSGVQRACEGIADSMMARGCVLVLSVEDAQVLACVSRPDFDPNHVEDSIEAQDTALLNRAFSAYAVGSVFKPVLAAAALEKGQAWHTLDCVGYLQVSDHIYRCAGGVPHGETDLAGALEKSCNCYFIELGQALGAHTLETYAAAFGFGQPVYLAGGLKAAAGNLPDESQLEDLGQQANFSFGQGALLATPVQVAGMMNTIAADGVYRTPTFLLRTFSAADGTTKQTWEAPEARTVVQPETARTLQKMLAGVVSDGLGREAQPTWGTAAGKTGTAQTGRYDPEGEEYKNLWFAGFYPAEDPQYTIVVMQDDQTETVNSSAAIFSRVCDALALLDGTETAAETGEIS